jgi:F-type H+-transporting ATPase subunit delta
MSVSLVARRYATALLEIGSETGQLDELVAEIGRLASAYETSAELRNVIDNPLVSHEAKKAVVKDLAGVLGLEEMARNTALMMVDRRRFRTLPHVARTLREMGDARKGVLRAEVTSAAPLGDAYCERLQAQLERMTGRKVIVDRQIDSTLIAGVVTRIGDRIVDGSLRTRLSAMRDALLPQN